MDDIATLSTPPPSRPRREILEYLEIPLRRPLHILIPLVVITAVAVGMSYYAKEKYWSSTVILVESEKMPDSFVPKMATETMAKRLHTLRQEILSRTRLEQVIRELDPYPRWLEKMTLSDLIEYMRSQIYINVRGGDAFTIEFEHWNPQTTMHVANRLATLFIDEVTQERARQAEEAHSFIESQVQESRREIEANEQAVRQYKEAHMGSLPEQLSANLATLQRLQMEQQAVAESLRLARERQRAVAQGLADELRGAGPSGGVVSPLAEIAQLRNQLASLRSRYTDEHPDVRQVLARIASLEEKLAQSESSGGSDSSAAVIRAQAEQARREVATLEEKNANLERRIAALQNRVEETPRVEQELATLTRDFKKLNENYLALLSKKLDAQMAEKLEERWKGEHFRILDPAHLPERPFAPKRSRYLLVGIMLGLLVGVGLAVAAEILDHSLKGAADVKDVLPYPVLAVIPHLGGPRAFGRGGATKRGGGRSGAGRASATPRRARIS
jgi:polysaccharide chain length determinant protein (PEP-CTERM system associated)